MVDAEKIRTEYERKLKALKRRPAAGRQTDVAKVRVKDDLTCDIEDGPWKLTSASGLSENKVGPGPGVFVRAALGSCLGLSYMTWAARLGVPISSVEVEVQTDFDARGTYGLDGIPAGFEEVRYTVTVESPAPKDDIVRVLDTADAGSCMFNVFSRPIKLCRHVHINTPQG